MSMLKKFLLSDRRVKNFMYLKLAMGFYNEYNFDRSSHKISIISRAYCICLPSILIFFSFNTSHMYVLLNSAVVTTQYLLIVLISHFTNEEYFAKFYFKLRSIDDVMGLGARYGGDMKFSSLLTLPIIMARTIGLVGFYFLARLRDFTICSMALNVVAIGNVLGSLIGVAMFEMLWHRVAALRNQLECELSTVCTRQDRAERTVVKMKKCLRVYKSLLDCLRDTGAAPKLMMFINLVYSLPRVLLMAHQAIVTYPALFHMIFVSLEGASVYLVTCMPAVLMECCASEVDRIKLLITKQLLLCTGADDQLFAAIEDTHKFLELRPFRFTVFRVFNLDATLTINLVSLYVTYVIVLVQFMHLFD